MVPARFRRAVEGHRVRVRENNPDQRHRDFEFNLRELAGSMGDFGTLFPLAIGYIAVCRLDPAGLFIWMGLVNIATGVIYRLPMPVEPKKVNPRPFRLKCSR